MKAKEIKRLKQEINLLKAKILDLGEQLKFGYCEDKVARRNSLSVDVARLEDKLRRATDNRAYINVDYGYKVEGLQGMQNEI